MDPRTVFVIHGRNDSMRQALFAFLRSIRLEPIEWSQALALTGKASPYIGEVLEAAFDSAQALIVLETPDEVAYLHESLARPGDPETKPQMQARPNVLFEAGMALGKNPDRTLIIEVGDVRPFSDISGRHVVRLNNTVATRQEVASRLKTAGCPVDISGTDWHNQGDFSAPSPPLLPNRTARPNSIAAEHAYPAHLEHRRNSSNDVLLIGNLLRRTSELYSRHLPATLERGGHVRVMVTSPDYWQMVGKPELSDRALVTLQTLRAAAARVPHSLGSLTLRTFERVPFGNWNVLDANSHNDDSLIVWQFSQLSPYPESGPILSVGYGDAWFEEFAAEARRIWAAGKDWPG